MPVYSERLVAFFLVRLENAYTGGNNTHVAHLSAVLGPKLHMARTITNHGTACECSEEVAVLVARRERFR